MQMFSDEKLADKLFPKHQILRNSEKHFCLFDKLCQLMRTVQSLNSSLNMEITII